jgi:hypothetical protein
MSLENVCEIDTLYTDFARCTGERRFKGERASRPEFFPFKLSLLAVPVANQRDTSNKPFVYVGNPFVDEEWLEFEASPAVPWSL